MANLGQKILGFGLGIPVDPDWSWKDKGPPSGSVGEKPNISPAPDRVISASGESMLSPAYERWMEKYGYDYNPDGTPKYDVGYDPQERAKSIGYDKYRPNTMKPREIEEWQKGYEKDRLAKEELDKKIADAKKEAEEREAFLGTPKGRMQTMWNDADKRDAILSGISEAMLETRTGAEAYGSRISQAQKNVRQNLKTAEATNFARAQAALNMQKTAAETNKLNNPAQFMSDTQKEASSIASMEHRLGSPEWKEKYAGELRRIAYKDMLSGPVDGIMAISEYMMKMPNIDPTMKQIYTDIINQLMGTIQGATGGDVAATSRASNTIIGGND